MLFAFDAHDKRIHIDDTQSNMEYYCPYCGTPLITKKGDIRQHHFSHRPNHICTDTWERENSYDISPWHNEWQGRFPKENQEIRLWLGETKHRADILTGRTVVEFQHSILPAKKFDDRNHFYYNLNYKVIWLFDLSEDVETGKLYGVSNNEGLHFIWKNPKKAFNSYDVKAGCVDLFFQLSDDESSCIVRVTDVSDFGFERFTATEMMSKTEFLAYTGLVNGKCASPDLAALGTDERYMRFKEKHNIVLNPQQERVVQSIEGAILLLAVPGSGKTTVLVDRLGYMVCEKGIDPEKILAITYNRQAAAEMKHRFDTLFGKECKKAIDFRTINSLSEKIYRDYCTVTQHKKRELIQDAERKNWLIVAYREVCPDDFPSESDLIELGSKIAYAKNMRLTDEEIRGLDSDCPHFSQMYQIYRKKLKEQGKMDFDDQMYFAYWILTHDMDRRAYWQKRYSYICIDEAQDTSKIQHEIIRILAQGNNLFMVGDEDQSIYGFRGAYPKALLNFRTDYTNPYILRMERNYRSTPQIVEKAQRFISENQGRYDKEMVAVREDGAPVELIRVNSLEAQYQKVLDVAKAAKGETAFLYRNNESAVALVDLFLRNGVSFNLKKPEMNFFGCGIVRDIVAYLSLAIDPFDTLSFNQICNKGILFLKKKQKEYAIKNSKNKKITVFDAVASQMAYLPYENRDRAEKFRKAIGELREKSTEGAINSILSEGYRGYIRQKKLDFGKIETLLQLAKQEPVISKFLDRLIELESLMKEGFYDPQSLITFSTIHTSKGLEYDTVYMVDIYDGRFPSSTPNYESGSKDNADATQEERRIFYVGITRAKNKLALFSIADKPSSYIDSLFPNHREVRSRGERDRVWLQYETLQENLRRDDAQRENVLAVQRMREEERKKDPEILYNEVKDQDFTQQTKILDSAGQRWVKCEICGRILPATDFVTYGGLNHVNLGICKSCGIS